MTWSGAITPTGTICSAVDDDGVGRHRHDRVEVACRQRIGEVAEIVGQEGMHQREMGAQRGLEQVSLAVDLDLRLPSSTIVPTPVGVSTPPRPQPPARIRSTSVPCGTSLTAIFPAIICSCTFGLSPIWLAMMFATSEASNSLPMPRPAAPLVGDDREVRFSSADEFVNQRAPASPRP